MGEVPQFVDKVFQLDMLTREELALIALFARTTLEQADEDPEIRKQVGYETAQSLRAKANTAVAIEPDGDEREVHCSRCGVVIAVAKPEEMPADIAKKARLTCVKCIRRVAELTGGNPYVR